MKKINKAKILIISFVMLIASLSGMKLSIYAENANPKPINDGVK